MATLILATIGRALGGRIGSAIGAVVGQSIDRKLFGPKGREGPRLDDLKIQTSSYGNPIPKVFGTMRLSGTVIWATDLKETSSRVSGGKGQPKSTVYSYSASFAVALSARRITGIGRIWADGNLLRGAAGDFKTQTGFRLHSGDEAQTVDPLIAAIEGAENAPAYRGLAYAVFEDFQLGDYGNRIPSLSFEVIADEDGTSIKEILQDVSPKDIYANAPTGLAGYAAHRGTVATAAGGLSEAIPIRLRDDGDMLHIEEAPGTALAIPDQALGASVDAQRAERIKIDQRSAGRIPARLTLIHADPARDFQIGNQHARRDVGGIGTAEIELPAAISAESARAIIERRMAANWANRRTAQISLPLSFAGLSPGQSLVLEGRPETWAIETLRIETMVVKLELVRLAQQSTLLLPATAGRFSRQADLVHGPTLLRVLDLPPIEQGVRTTPLVAVAAGGLSPGWRRAPLLFSTDNGASWLEAGETALPAVLGSLTSPLDLGPDDIIDQVRYFDVALVHSAMELAPVSDDALYAGENLAMVGEELLQFGRVEALGPNHYRLSRLLRGRRGSSAGSAPLGTPFTLISRETLLPIEIPAGTTQVRVLASGVGDPIGGTETNCATNGKALQPLSPVHLSAIHEANGSLSIRWTRRSRDGWRWLDSVDAPLAEERESYIVFVTPNVGPERLIETDVPMWSYTVMQRAADLAGGASSITVAVRQAGIFDNSVASNLNFSIQ